MRGHKEARSFCQRLLADPTYRTNLAIRLREGTLPPAVETMIWHYANGKPAETINLRDKTPDSPDKGTRVERLQALLVKAQQLDEAERGSGENVH